jgi:exopolysaccharide production protein ExoZ
MRARATILEIQILRAVAAMAVVVMHIGIELRYWGKATISWTDVGNAGVDLFFVISGFIMVFISWERFGRRDAPADFFVRRLIRIVPLYWLVTTGYILAGSFPASRIITSYLFVPDFGTNAAPLPVVLQGWTLNFEMFFYLVLALVLLLPRLAAIATVSALLVALVLLKVPYYGQSVILEFVLGLWIGWAFQRGLTLPLLVRVAAIVAGFAAVAATMAFPAQDRLLGYGIPAALIVAGATLGTPIRSSRLVRALVLLGDASYALYLTHPLMTRLFATSVRHVAGFDSLATQALYFVIAVAASIALAILVHLAIERPITTTLQRWWTRRDGASAPAAKPGVG